MVCYHVKLHQSLTSTFQFIGIFLKVKCYQNPITSRGTLTNIATKLHQFLLSSFSDTVQTHTWTDRTNIAD